jgi:predicted TIM-barrel fold metal-dependent hydrolase
MILDSHCHAWSRWPYLPRVPDEHERGTADQLIYEMDVHGIDQAVVVCAAIDHNPDNVEYVARARESHPGRLHVVADLDCTWSATYHVPGSADRLRRLADRYPLAGVAHYVEDVNDGWLRSDEADALFAAAAERGLFVGLAATPAWQADLRRLAQRHPDVPVLCHHLGGIRAGDADDLAEVIASAAVPSIYVKVSGFHYASERGWDYPWPAAVAAIERIAAAYGPGRLCWGSDFPASTRFTTYRQSLEVVREHCPFFSAEDLRLVLGETLRGVLLAH